MEDNHTIMLKALDNDKLLTLLNWTERQIDETVKSRNNMNRNITSLQMTIDRIHDIRNKRFKLEDEQT